MPPMHTAEVRDLGWRGGGMGDGEEGEWRREGMERRRREDGEEGGWRGGEMKRGGWRGGGGEEEN